MIDESYPDVCPLCEADLRAEVEGFYRVIGISTGDSIFAWECPDCGGQWARVEPPATGFRKCNIRVVR